MCSIIVPEVGEILLEFLCCVVLFDSVLSDDCGGVELKFCDRLQTSTNISVVQNVNVLCAKCGGDIFESTKRTVSFCFLGLNNIT
ncbi:MAG: hypothetical protein LBQ66_08220 [Planctomycetaceae bacterium]|nr:hypothetical protein [Planctomycetaceae bacterium]